jgi:hypothetical protein
MTACHQLVWRYKSTGLVPRKQPHCNCEEDSVGCMDIGMLHPPRIEYGGIRMPCNLPSAVFEHLQFHVELIFDTATKGMQQRAHNK